MAKQQQQEEPRVYEQTEDERGRTRLDRPFTAEEAAAQDAAHRERYREERAKRFGGGHGRTPEAA